jgi:hypothetical protein
MHKHRGAGEAMQFAESADVVNVRMSADDGLYRELVAAEQIHDARYFIAGIDDQSFAGDGIADDGAIALQHAYRKGDVNQLAWDGRFGPNRLWFSHLMALIVKYNIREV